MTQEQQHYRNIFNREFPYCHKIIPYFWMPKYVDSTDSSARTLSIYNKQEYRERINV